MSECTDISPEKNILSQETLIPREDNKSFYIQAAVRQRIMADLVPAFHLAVNA